MHNFVHEMLHNSPSAQRIEALWQVNLHNTGVSYHMSSLFIILGIRSTGNGRSSVRER